MNTDIRTESIQCWPSGDSYQYQGDIHGPAGQRQLRSRGVEDWRPGTADEWRQIEIARLAQIYADRDILACQSSLIDELLKNAGEIRGDLGNGFEYDQIENVYTDPSDWAAGQCREYLNDEGADIPDVPTMDCETCDGSGEVDECDSDGIALTRDGEILKVPCKACTDGTVPDPDADDDDSPRGYLTELRDAVKEHSDDHPAEIFEWWLVSSWLCGQLRAIGQPVIDNDYGYWWGRTCTGQGLIMDGTLQRIAASFVEARS